MADINTPRAEAQSHIPYSQINPLIYADGDTDRVRFALGAIADVLADGDLVGKKDHDYYFGLSELIRVCVAALEYMPCDAGEGGAA